MSAALRYIAGGVLDLIYPPRCLICERYNRPPLCEECASTFKAIPKPLCTYCGRPKEEQTECRTCTDNRRITGEDWQFDSARSAGVFEGALRLAIHQLKYRDSSMLGEILGAYLANQLALGELFPENEIKQVDGVVATPMHPARERQRGFNQSHLLAHPVAEILGVPLLPRSAVKRASFHRAQVGLLPDHRRQNIQGAFYAAEESLKNRHLLLVDDVFTTGATVNACAAALRHAGADTIRVATLAGGD